MAIYRIKNGYIVEKLECSIWDVNEHLKKLSVENFTGDSYLVVGKEIQYRNCAECSGPRIDNRKTNGFCGHRCRSRNAQRRFRERKKELEGA